MRCVACYFLGCFYLPDIVLTQGHLGTDMFRIFSLLLIAAFLGLFHPMQAVAQTPNPLQSTETESPRATLFSFLSKLEKAYEIAGSDGPEGSEFFVRQAARHLDTSHLPTLYPEPAAIEAALKLKEVLDRIPLPAPEDVPGLLEATGNAEGSGVIVGAESEASGVLQIWTIPGSNIRIRRVEEGDREGEYLFVPNTVERIHIWHDRVLDAPYREDATPGIYQAYYSTPGSHVDLNWSDQLPAWLTVEIGEQTLWQWFAALLAISLGAVVIGAALRTGMRIDLALAAAGDDEVRRPWRLATTAAVAFSNVVIASAGPVNEFVNLSGTPFLWTYFGLWALWAVFTSWLFFLLSTQFFELLSWVQGHDPRAARAQLFRLIGAFVGILAVVAIISTVADQLGLPAYSVVTGLGVGGIAVSLAARETLMDLFGSFVVMLERPYRIGDFVEMGGDSGTVEMIGFRSTRIRTTNDTVVAVPNSVVSSGAIRNLGLRRFRLTDTRLRIDADTPPGEVRDFLARVTAILASHPSVTGTNYHATLVSADNGSLELRIFFYLDVPNWPTELATRQEILFAVLEDAESAGLRLSTSQLVELLDGRGEPSDAEPSKA